VLDRLLKVVVFGHESRKFGKVGQSTVVRYHGPCFRAFDQIVGRMVTHCAQILLAEGYKVARVGADQQRSVPDETTRCSALGEIADPRVRPEYKHEVVFAGAPRIKRAT